MENPSVNRVLFCPCGGAVLKEHKTLKMACSECKKEMKWCDVLTSEEFRQSIEGTPFLGIYDNIVKLFTSDEIEWKPKDEDEVVKLELDWDTKCEEKEAKKKVANAMHIWIVELAN